MTSPNYIKTFEDAVTWVNQYDKPIPPDILLKLYAYYKRSVKGQHTKGTGTPLIDGFKANAILQVQNLTEEEAKKRYIELVNQMLKP